MSRTSYLNNLKIRFLILTILGFIVFNACGEKEANDKVFSLNGTIKGDNTEYLLLIYTDSTFNRKIDTIQVVNNSFITKGTLCNPQEVALVSNQSPGYITDENGLVFFLEAGEVNLKLEEGHFVDALITGSKTQKEKDSLEKSISPLQKEIETIIKKRDDLITINKESFNDDIKIQIDSLRVEWFRMENEITTIKLRYALNNPDSYLAVNIIQENKSLMSIDSLSMFYTNLSSRIKESSYGKNILEQIELHVVDAGDTAPSFTKEDINGNDLSLKDFKGKTVLLDFGASWCVPCKKEIPEIKKIYNQYDSKGLKIIGVSLDKDKTDWVVYVKEQELNWHHVYDGFLNDKKEGTVSKLYSVQPIPAYILIDENGIIVDRYRAADKNNKSLEELENRLKTILP